MLVELFLNLIKVSIGQQGCLSISPSEAEWQALYKMAEEQALLGVCFAGVKKLETQQQEPPREIIVQWLAVATQIQQRNEVMDAQCADLYSKIHEIGFKSCILKGQGLASFYRDKVLSLKEFRQAGDIDIWVKGKPFDVVAAIKEKRCHVKQVDYRDAVMDIFDHTIVEVHFMPSILYNPCTNKKLQEFYTACQDECCKHHEEGLQFATPTMTFNLVQAMVHVCGHFLEEGVGLRQLMDYYFLLLHSNASERNEAFALLKSIRKAKMVAGVMYVLKRAFDLDDTLMLCRPNGEIGKFLLNEILTGGNFGHYDTRIKHVNKKNRWAHTAVVMRRNLHFLRYMPDEILCAPFWKLWHYCWRKRRGFL